MHGEARELKRYSEEEFYAYLDKNDVRAELIDGYIIENMGQPSFLHQDIMAEVRNAFIAHLKKNKLSYRVGMDNEVRLDDSNVVVPDVFVTCRPQDIVNGKRLCGVPEFVMEIVSNDRFNDYYRKLGLYKSFGVREYWIVDPKTEQVTVWFFEDEGSPFVYRFDEDIPVSCCSAGKPLVLNIAKLIENIY